MAEEPMTPSELKSSRKHLNLTQQKMAEALGVSPRYTTYLEAGEQPIIQPVKFAVYWLLLPKRIRNRYLPKIDVDS